MMRLTVVIFSLVLFSGCATKHYGRQGELTSYELETMTEREIDLEMAKVEGFIKHVEDESKFSGRSILSFMGDFGIGNVIEKDAALESAHKRLGQLNKAKAAKMANNSK